MKRINIVFSILMLFALTTSCSSLSPDPIEISNSLDIEYQTGPSIRPHTNLTVWIKNQTKYCISFPQDFGIKIFIDDGEKTEEVDNLVNFLGEGSRFLKPAGDIFSERSVDIFPDISGLSTTKPIQFYAMLHGNLCDDASVLIEKKIPFTVIP